MLTKKLVYLFIFSPSFAEKVPTKHSTIYTSKKPYFYKQTAKQGAKYEKRLVVKIQVFLIYSKNSAGTNTYVAANNCSF